jgi:hypothetical protein
MMDSPAFSASSFLWASCDDHVKNLHHAPGPPKKENPKRKEKKRAESRREKRKRNEWSCESDCERGR